jgi:predicted alpha/beta superfamily hydrolase
MALGNKQIRSIVLFAAAVCFVRSVAWGQESAPPKRTPISVGFSVPLDSQALAEKRTINVYLPPSYEAESQRQFPVIYLLDGGVDEDYVHQVGIVQFMAMYRLMPESIVIGIANTDRKRDMTHPSNDPEEKTNLPTSGGSANFIQFLGDEVQPFVKQNFRAAGERTLVGQSFGGLLATEVLLKRPELFDHYVIVSPSLYWSKQELISGIDKFLSEHPRLEKKIFLSLGKEHPLMQEAMNKFVEALSNRAPGGLRWDYVPLFEETHATIMHRATYRAYEFLYGDKFKGM